VVLPTSITLIFIFLLLKEFMNRERLRVPLPPPLPPPRPEINKQVYNSIMHNMIRPLDRLGVPVHERLSVGRVPLVEDRRRIRRRSKVLSILNLYTCYLLNFFLGGPKTKIRESVKPNSNTNGSNISTTKGSKSKKRQILKQR